MIHIAPWAAAEGLMAGAGRLLPPGAPLFLYGPYKRDGRHTAPSNAAFDADLRRRDPAWGVRDLDDVARLADAHGLGLAEIVEMPANNSRSSSAGARIAPADGAALQARIDG